MHVYGTYRARHGSVGSYGEADLPVDLHVVECLEWEQRP